MEVLCRLSYSSAGTMIPPRTDHTDACDHGGVRAKALLVVLALALAACAEEAPNHPLAGNRIWVRIRTDRGPLELTNLEVARTPEARAAGLMGRTSLARDEGMAFLFEGPTNAPFWMKDTLIPLSIAFWDEGGLIVDILDMQPCRQDPCPLYRASGSYVGAIEMNLGFFDRHGVSIGDRIEYRLLGE